LHLLENAFKWKIQLLPPTSAHTLMHTMQLLFNRQH